MPAELLAAMAQQDLPGQLEHPEALVQQGQPGQLVHKAYRDFPANWGLLEMLVHLGHKVQRDLLVLGSAMETPRATSSTGMGLLGRT